MRVDRVVASLMVGVVVTSCTSGSSKTTGGPGDPEAVGVVEVIDGDSLVVDLDGGTEIRLIGINAPEHDECHGNEARTILEELVGDHDVVLVPAEEGPVRDQFGRLLGDIRVDEVRVNLEMVRRGAAMALQGGGGGDEQDLVAANEEAWEARIGMWDESACGGFDADVRVADVTFDPPGPDDDDLVGEWVAFVNRHTGAVDLGGWIVRDESSRHRYRFPDGTTLLPGAELRLRTGCGTDGDHDLHWCADGPVWNNAGDTVLLQTPTGTVVDRVSFPGGGGAP